MAKRALIVEDNDLVRELLTDQLTKKQFAVTCAEDGEKGLALLTGPKTFDVAFVDVVMPKLSGLEFVKCLRALPPPVAYLPVIMVTGYSDRNLILKAAELGVNEFLLKPWQQNDLNLKIQAVERPKIELAEIKEMLTRLHLEDKDLLQQPGLEAFKDGDNKGYSVAWKQERLCLVLKKGSRASELTTRSQAEITQALAIFIKRKNHWFYIWPDHIDTASASNTASDDFLDSLIKKAK